MSVNATDEESSVSVSSLSVGLILFSVTLWTIVANISVIVAFLLDKHLREGGISNYLILNLAISDLLLGLAVLPFSATYSTLGLWYFGEVLCEFWLIIDVLCSTASIWNLLIIAFDRYIATNYPLLSRSHRHSRSVIAVSISIVWLVALLICLLPIFVIENDSFLHLTSKYNPSTRQCELYKDLKFVLTSSLLSFYFPLLLMIFLYSKVFFVLRHQHHHEVSSEVRLTRSLSVLMLCFLICWLPFFTLYIIRAACQCLSFDAIELFVWLGYSNSSLNPILYAILNRNFRHAFKNLTSIELRRRPIANPRL